MRFTILLLCIALALFAFVDASAIRRDELEKKCESDQDSPSHIDHHHSQSTSTDAAANVDKAVDTKATTTSKDTTKSTDKSNKGTDTTTTAKDDTKDKGTNTTTTAAASTDKASDVNKNKDDSSSSSSSTTTTTTAADSTETGTATSDDNSGGSNTCLAASALQTGSESTGQSANSTAGQVASQTSDNNFINICEGQTLTNGLQVINGSCNGIPLGFIPAKTNMPSSLILFPQHNQDIAANTSFQIQVTTTGMELGHFTNADETYYSAPTQLNGDGLVIGHTHVTVQDLGGSFFPTEPLDSAVFAFFQGINSVPNADNVVFANVTNGLPPGFYRVCTMVANANHSPLQMPVAQRGNQDDCHYFSVGQSDSTSSSASSTSTTDDVAASSSAASSSATTSAAAKKGGKKGGKSRRRRSRM